jgi:hypothetical protein
MGNPDRTPYAGDPGSVYDRAANPPANSGRLFYNPNGPLPTHMPADETLPPAPPPINVTPLPPPAR